MLVASMVTIGLWILGGLVGLVIVVVVAVYVAVTIRFKYFPRDLFDAVVYSSKWKVLRMLEAGANPNEVKTFHNGQQTTPLLVAALYGRLEAAKLLITAGANVNFLATHEDWPHGQGNTALIFAAREGHLEVARLLLQEGADPMVRSPTSDGKGQYAVEIADRYGHKEVWNLICSTLMHDKVPPKRS